VNAPPKIMSNLLAWIVDYKDRENLTGDFSEVFSDLSSKSGYTRAIVWYIFQICKLIPIYLIESLIWSSAMFNNYFKIAFRNLIKQKTYSLINIMGLALGMAVAILILLYIKSETSYDKFNRDADRIVRLERQFLGANGEVRGAFASIAPSFVPIIERDIPDFENITRIFYPNEITVGYGNKSFTETRFFFAEDDIFEIFTLPFIEGDPKTALKNPFTIVLSETTSNKYFGSQNPIGKMFQIFDRNYNVTGVIKDTPYNSHVHFDFIASYLSLLGINGGSSEADDYFLGNSNFSDNVCHTYGKLAKGVSVESVQAKIPMLLDKTFPPRTGEDGRVIKMSETANIFLRKLTDIHLHANNPNELEPTGNSIYITIFTVVAIFILLIACINFINLSTARSSRRAKEVGLRKVVGAFRRMLISQFLGESMFISLLSVIGAVVLVMLAIPYFETFAGTQIKFNIAEDSTVLFILLAVFLSAGLIAGIYPALYLSAYKPALILRGEVTKGTKGVLFRKVLVVFQFAISSALIIAVAIIFKQMNYINSANLGFNKENVVLLPLDGNMKDRWVDIKQNLLKDTRIVSAAISKRAPSGRLMDAPGFQVELKGEILNSPFGMPHNRVDYDFFKTFGMEIIAGRDFSVDHPTDDSLAYVINETACRRLGFAEPKDAIGTNITARRIDAGKIIGVVKDFHYESLREEILPIITYIVPGQANTIAIRIAPGNVKSAIDYIKDVLQQYEPGMNFQYDFLDTRLKAQYENEIEMMELFVYFSLLAVAIACLGLFGLAAFTAEQKVKEIGIRKTLGASIPGLTFLLTKQFALWVVLANVVAAPLVYFAMTDWLNGFAYRTDITIGVFMIGFGLSLLIAVATVSVQTIKAAMANPANTLRTE